VEISNFSMKLYNAQFVSTQMKFTRKPLEIHPKGGPELAEVTQNCQQVSGGKPPEEPATLKNGSVGDEGEWDELCNGGRTGTRCLSTYDLPCTDKGVL
jgi:hypothetical protein